MTTPHSAPVDGFVSDGYGDRPWRVGRKVFRTVYDAHDTLIGVMDTALLASLVVTAVNHLSDPNPTCGNANSDQRGEPS